MNASSITILQNPPLNAILNQMIRAQTLAFAFFSLLFNKINIAPRNSVYVILFLLNVLAFLESNHRAMKKYAKVDTLSAAD
jgi:hypothetical protein